ncbi:LOW QUALITY PROTEIN: Hypothetical protein PHPALM_15887 [Phytophthora palmivora]|uniref:Tyr recombinase domain-containing protein n=1 Tax=Phytophthora palmivora TaxID=4796 RepID=A0A2P4XR36_9STRA|nr:LOW QUALITY PROTEIN: Hypothetical protein PHPALM_15887 [Phytophthora palmivora]
MASTGGLQFGLKLPLTNLINQPWFYLKPICMRLIGSKTNQNDVPMTRILARSGHPFLCPVFGALILHQSRKNLPAKIPAAVFLVRGGASVCVSTSAVSGMLDRIKHAATEVGHDPRLFRSHSLRSGRATHMYRSGTDALIFQVKGRRVSDAFKTYTSCDAVFEYDDRATW